MEKIISWIRTIPFLLAFTLIMLTGDALLRLFWSKQLHEKINPILNYLILRCLSLFCGTKFHYHFSSDFHKYDKSKLPKIIIANHQSLMDIAILNCSFKGQSLRYIAKTELAKNLPYVSIALRKLPHCLIDRGDRGQALKAIKSYCPVMKEDQSILVIFPEGTRARDGVIKKFKTGGIQALVDEFGEVVVFPVAISGSYLIAKHKMLPVPANININFTALDPVVVARTQDLKMILDQIEDDIKNNL